MLGVGVHSELLVNKGQVYARTDCDHLVVRLNRFTFVRDFDDALASGARLRVISCMYEIIGIRAPNSSVYSQKGASG